MRKKFGLGGGILTLAGVAKKAGKEIAETAVERKDQLLEIIKKTRAKKLFGRGRLKQKTIKMKDDLTGKAFKAFKDESLVMDADTYDKVKNMPDKKVINNLKAFGFKFKDK
jgi:hypothetical protein|tara:strand:+ start:110 stop:442 length:333 start_codon:yes stop_codon:yes gene_type:complete